MRPIYMRRVRAKAKPQPPEQGKEEVVVESGLTAKTALHEAEAKIAALEAELARKRQE